MFTKSDYIEYFEQIADVEKDMMLKLENELKMVEDAYIRGELLAVAKDEARHYAYVKEILDAIV
jgi:rubrerythrin